MPLGVYLLGLGVFSLGTSEFMIAGLIPDLTADLGITIPQAGVLITAFAIGMVIGAPVVTLLTLRLPPKQTLLAAVAVYVVMHLIGVLVQDYQPLLITRVIAAVVYAAFWAIAAVTAGRLAGAQHIARAMAILVGGLSLANLLGVPAGAWLADQAGWRSAFLAVAGGSLITGLLIMIAVPATGPSGGSRDQQVGARLRAELAAFARLRMWLALLTTALFQGGVFAAFSYFAPLLITISGVPVARVPVYLLIFGAGALAGTMISGRVADRGPLANVAISLGAAIVASAVLLVVSGSPIGVGVAMAAYGLAAFSIAGALNARVLGLAGDAPTLAAAVNTSAFNVGNAAGPWFGGLVIAAGFGFRAPVVVGMILFAGALLVAGVSWAVERRDRLAPAVRPAVELAETCTS
jgi:DHA1 family chloramphenicol resistance protein-like MFS transporter